LLLGTSASFFVADAEAGDHSRHRKQQRLQITRNDRRDRKVARPADCSYSVRIRQIASIKSKYFAIKILIKLRSSRRRTDGKIHPEIGTCLEKKNASMKLTLVVFDGVQALT
jgi:hypothetical protein